MSDKEEKQIPIIDTEDKHSRQFLDLYEEDIEQKIAEINGCRRNTGPQDLDPSLRYSAEKSIELFEAKHMTGEHPEALWSAILTCEAFGIPWPWWIYMAIKGIAENLMLAPCEGQSLGAFLSNALGGFTKTKINAVRKEAQKTEVYIGVEEIMQKEGHKTDQARRLYGRRNKGKIKKTDSREAHKDVQAEFTAIPDLINNLNNKK